MGSAFAGALLGMNLLQDAILALTLSISDLALIVSGLKPGLCLLLRYLPRLPSPTFCYLVPSITDPFYLDQGFLF